MKDSRYIEVGIRKEGFEVSGNDQRLERNERFPAGGKVTSGQEPTMQTDERVQERT